MRSSRSSTDVVGPSPGRGAEPPDADAFERFFEEWFDGLWTVLRRVSATEAAARRSLVRIMVPLTRTWLRSPDGDAVRRAAVALLREEVRAARAGGLAVRADDRAEACARVPKRSP
jgi:hypothetical protein